MPQIVDASQFLSRLFYTIGSIHPTEQKIKEFKTLQARWHYGQGVEFSQKVLDAAIAMHRSVVSAGYSDTDAFPGFNGEIQISIYELPKSCEITIQEDGRWSMVFEEDGKESFECSGENILCMIPGIVGIVSSTWSTFTSYLRNIGKENFEDSVVWLSSHPTPMGASRLSKWNVLLEPPSQSADTLEATTPTLLENRRCSGSFQTVFYRTPHLSFRH